MERQTKRTMTSARIAKHGLQKILRELRGYGLEVIRLSAGYEVKAKDGRVILRAMNGRFDYLVRFETGLLEVSK